MIEHSWANKAKPSKHSEEDLIRIMNKDYPPPPSTTAQPKGLPPMSGRDIDDTPSIFSKISSLFGRKKK